MLVSKKAHGQQNKWKKALEIFEKVENILDKLNSEALNHSERYEVATIFMKIEDLFSKRKMRKKSHIIAWRKSFHK
jgi:flagellin-specific chaperone FliS